MGQYSHYELQFSHVDTPFVTPEDLAVYKLLSIHATSDLDVFERAVDMFLARRAELLKALDDELKKKQDAKDSPGAAKKPLDDASLAAMSESDRYDLARQKTAELTEEQLKAMIHNPGKTAKGFAKGALLLNTPETFEQIGKELQEVANSDANTWARWAAGTGAGAKLSGWLAALAGVLFVASYFTGIGEVATLGYIAGAGLVLLGSTIALSFTESELRIKAASQATTVKEFDRNNELAAEARATGIVSLGFVVIAALLHFTAKALFPKTMAKLGTAVKNFRERVRLKGSIYEIKPSIVGEMNSLKSELKGAIEGAKKDAAASADGIANLSTEQLAAELDKGTGIFDQSKLPADQRVNYGELIKTPEGRVAVEAYRAKLLEVLKTDVPAEIDRLGSELGSKIDAFLKDVDAAQNHDELAAAADKVGDTLTPEEFNRHILEQKERITNQKLEKAAAEAHKEAQDTAANLPPKRVKQDVYIMDQKGDDIGQADVIETDARGNTVFVEEKNAQGIGKINPKTGQPYADPAVQLRDFADKQIFKAGVKKANAILKGVSTRGDKGAAVPGIDVIRSIKTIRFEIQGDSPQLRAAVEAQLVELRKLFPALQFDVRYGVVAP